MTTASYHIQIDPIPAEDGGGFIGWVPDLPGCISDGRTPAEALANANLAIDEWINEAMRLGRPIPAPSRRTARV
jgi:antitoxin HicB